MTTIQIIEQIIRRNRETGCDAAPIVLKEEGAQAKRVRRVEILGPSIVAYDKFTCCGTKVARVETESEVRYYE